MWTLDTFYNSTEWRLFREVVIADRVRDDGFVYDEVTGLPIVRAYDIILHHVMHLTDENVNDRSISLNPENIQIVSHKTHNLIHEKLGYSRKEIFLVYGPPLAGKTSYVKSTALEGDLIIDMDSIWECISGQPRYVKPGRLRSVAFGVRDYLMDCLRVRNGKWQNAYIVGGFPLISERERMQRTYGAREVFIDADKATCLARLKTSSDGRNEEEWVGYIDEWFRRYTPPGAPST